MAKIQYRDAYFVVNKNEYNIPVFINDIVKIRDEEVFSNDGNYLGYISTYVEDVLEIAPTLEQLRKDKIVPATSGNPLFLNLADLQRHNITKGVVTFSTTEHIIVYYGVIEIGEEETITSVSALYDDIMDNIAYKLTEEGLKYVESVMDSIEEKIDLGDKENLTCAEEREESKAMDNLFGNLGFGKLKGDRFKLSMNGIAVVQPSTGKYVVYNKDNNEFVDVSNLLFDIKDALFLLPAVEVNSGDTVLHEGKAYYVVDTTNEIKAVDYETCTQTVLIPKSTMFGIKYFQKVFSMFGDNFAAAGDLFSNPMMLMALMEGKNSDLTQMMLFNSMSNGDLGSNPMALAMMLKGDTSSDSLSTIALMSMFNNGTNPFAPKKKEVKKTEASNK